MFREVYHLQMALLSLSMICSLMVILVILVRVRSTPSLFQRYGFAIFGIFHVAKYGERRNLPRY